MTYGDYPDLRGVKKILVVKLRQLGDVLLATPVFSALRQQFPQAEIDAYVYSEAAVLLEGHPAVHAVLSCDRRWKKLGIFRRVFKELTLLAQIRRNSYDLVINLTEGDRGAAAAKVSGAPIRVGFNPKGGLLQRGVYTHIAKHCPSLRHTVERNLDALRRLGIFPSHTARELVLHVDADALAKVKAIAGEGTFILIHPTSRWMFKCWSVDKMKMLAERLLASGHRLIFTSGPDAREKDMLDQICAGLPVVNLAGQISLKELIAFVYMCHKLVCVDSLPFHIASAFKKPVAALFGPTSEITWGPWRNPNAVVLTRDLPCRPCYQDGCGGSKVSECIIGLEVNRVLQSKIFTEIAAPRIAIGNELVNSPC